MVGVGIEATTNTAAAPFAKSVKSIQLQKTFEHIVYSFAHQWNFAQPFLPVNPGISRISEFHAVVSFTCIENVYMDHNL